jgi:hypothetical protein
MPLIPTTTQQIDAWRAAKSENEHLEFKEAKNQFSFQDLLSYCVALANEGGGKMLLGIANKPPRPVVGTKAFENPAKTSQKVLNKLHFHVDIEEIEHQNRRILVIHIPSRPVGEARSLDGKFLMRSGESIVPMTSDRLREIHREAVPISPTPIKQSHARNRKKSRLGVGFSIIAVLILGGFLYWVWTSYRSASEKLQPPWSNTPPKIDFPPAMFSLPPRKLPDYSKLTPYLVRDRLVREAARLNSTWLDWYNDDNMIERQEDFLKKDKDRNKKEISDIISRRTANRRDISEEVTEIFRDADGLRAEAVRRLGSHSQEDMEEAALFQDIADRRIQNFDIGFIGKHASYLKSLAARLDEASHAK